MARPAPHEKRPLIAEALRARGRAAGHRLRGHARGRGGDRRAAHARSSARRRWPTTPGSTRERRADAQRRFLGRRGAGDRGHQRVRHGRGQAERAHGGARQRARPRSRPTTRRPAARAATALPARALLLAENRDKALHVHFIKREEVDADLPAALADRLAARRPTARAATRSTPRELARALGGGADRLRALLGHLARAGVIVAVARRRPTAWPAALSGAASTAAPRRCCRASIDEGASARWRQYREIWAYVEGDALPAPRDPAPLRRPRRARSAAGAPAATRATPALVPEPPPPAPEAIEDLDDAIVSVARGGAARGGPHHLRGDPARRAHEEDRAQLLRRPARLRHLVEHAPRRHPRARRRADRGGLARRPRGGPYPVLQVPRRRPRCRLSGLPRRRPRLGRGHEPPGDPRHGPRPRTGSRWCAWRPAARTRAGSSAPRRPASRPAVFADGRLRRPRGARRRAGRLARRARRGPGGARRLHGAALGAPFIRRFEGRIVNVHPSLLPGVPGRRAIEQALEYGVRVTGVTVHFVDEGVDSGPDHPAGGLRASVSSRHRGGRGEGPRDRAPAAAAGGAADRGGRRAHRPRRPAAWCGSKMAEAAERTPSAEVGAARRGAGSAARCSRVSDKRGLVDFARGLAELGVEIVSTGGTARELGERGHRRRARSRTTRASRRSSTGA